MFCHDAFARGDGTVVTVSVGIPKLLTWMLTADRALLNRSVHKSEGVDYTA